VEGYIDQNTLIGLETGEWREENASIFVFKQEKFGGGRLCTSPIGERKGVELLI
jgi:hypothetical protein